MKKHSVLGIQLAIALAGLATTSSVFARVEDAEIYKKIEAPCRKDEDTTQKIGLRKCSEMLPQAAELLEKRAKKYADTYYVEPTAEEKGKLFNRETELKLFEKVSTGSSTGTSTLLPVVAEKSMSCRLKPVPKPACNLAAGPLNGNTEEKENNHVGTSCGKWPYFETNLNGTTCEVRPNQTGDYGTIEDGYTRGTYIYGLTCHMTQVKNEVNQGILYLTKAGDGASQCSDLAEDYETLKTTTDKAVADIQKQLGSQANISDIENCGVNDANQSAGTLKQSACQLIAARQTIETMYQQLAACELFTRAQRKFEAFLAGKNNDGSFYDQVRAILNSNQCKSTDQSACSDQRIREGCYKPAFFNLYYKRLKETWPNPETLCQ